MGDDDLATLNEPNLQPAYDFGGVNGSVVLGKSPVVLRVGEESHSGLGEARLELVPHPRVCIYASFQAGPAIDAFSVFTVPENQVSLSFGGRDVPGFAAHLGGDQAEESLSLVWRVSRLPFLACGDENISISEVVFHLFNLPRIFSGQRTIETRDATRLAVEHIVLLGGPWRIEVRSLGEIDDVLKKVKEVGGYGLTHVGCVRKAAGSSFKGVEAAEVLLALRTFFSFACGLWSFPVCSVGFGAGGERVWEWWSPPAKEWQYVESWFDPHRGDQLERLFPGFIAKWEEPTWREALQEATHWHVKSNTVLGADAGIILTQTAIERLAYEYAVREKKLIHRSGFEKITSSDEFRLLLSSLEIPIDLPAPSVNLRALAAKRSWVDGPHAITAIRNSIVHPENQDRMQYTCAYREAWTLGLWYLELAILRLCGYTGTYSNRLLQGKWAGQVENVPWQR